MTFHRRVHSTTPTLQASSGPSEALQMILPCSSIDEHDVDCSQEVLSEEWRKTPPETGCDNDAQTTTHKGIMSEKE